MDFIAEVNSLGTFAENFESLLEKRIHSIAALNASEMLCITKYSYII